MALKDIKTKIQATLRTHKVTRAMEAVSAVKMRKTQQAALGGRAYARAAVSILGRLAGTSALKSHALVAPRKVETTALLVITSDKGLAGGLNANVLKRAAEVVAGKSVENVVVYAYGRKGEEYFSRRGYRIERAIENKRDDIDLAVVEGLAAELSAGHQVELFDEVVAVYSNFKSTFEQVPSVRKVLPLSLDALRQTVAEIVPAKGKWSDEGALESPASYEIEPSADEVLSKVLPRLLSVSIYHMLLEGKASEHSARMVAMKNASDKSKEVARDLTRSYNKVRQAAITREVSEIVSGREALAS
ncbi:MAG: ATP synthase F1 subunit gamma [Candidatus Pacebacteria bacterium]|nr:ATP synthase F1 subunit gamma [Candidatus Paceibacterota bacterium]MBP9840482.1 ATP synthase F1 subunit gamma [Candidatus Paceibacterota bacterium]